MGGADAPPRLRALRRRTAATSAPASPACSARSTRGPSRHARQQRPPDRGRVASGSASRADAAGLSGDERQRVEFLARYAAEGKGYLQLQSTRPQGIAYALTDSPVGQLVWIAEKFQEWTDPDGELPEDAVDRDQLLTNVSLYWFTRTGASAANFLYESAHSSEWRAPVRHPAGVGGVRRRRRSSAGCSTPSGRSSTGREFERGGHFAAMEAPDLLVGDLRAFLAAHR